MTRRQVLIVEDELVVQLHLASLVESLGHAVSGRASNEREALEAAAITTPDLVLMDVRLADGEDGVELARRLRRRYGCLVIFVTAYADPETVARSEDVEPAGYVVKPFGGPEVQAALRLTLGKLQPQGALATTGRAARDDGPSRLLVYSHDTFGLGHLRRSLKIIQALADRHGELTTLLVTGSPMVHRYRLPPRTDTLKLPAVRKVAPAAYEPRSLSMSGDGIQGMRRNLLLGAVTDFDPDLVLVDHAPLGMNGELVPALEWLERRGRARCVLGLRDVIDDPQVIADSWRREGIYDHIARHYDHLVVYGSPEVYDTLGEYEFPAELVARSHYVHHVGPGPETEAATETPAGLRPSVVVSIGGGDGGGDSVIGPFLDMLLKYADEVDFDTEIVTGPFVSAEDEQAFRRRAEGLAVSMQTFLPVPTERFARADLVVATCGYNTATELLASAARALFIPRVMHRQEQLIRARRLADLGLVRWLHPREVTAERLLAEVQRALADPRRPLVEARRAGRIPLDGAERFAELCTPWLRGRLREAVEET